MALVSNTIQSNTIQSNAIMDTIVTRNGWQGFMSFVRDMRIFKGSYRHSTGEDIGFTMFEYCSDGIHKNELEASELFNWCIEHDVI